ncbi:MAG: glycogen debranching protein GlgX [Fusobacteria bacterium]|nr:glycogen debranching protein GlgX [Fusobacteriota bacterium]
MFDDIKFTHEYKGFKLRAGKPLMFGATIIPYGINFSVFSRYATSCELLLFKKGEEEPYAVIPFLDEYRIGNVFNMIVFDLDYENIEYAYRMDGPFNVAEGFWFNKEKVLLDPYAKSISGRDTWGESKNIENKISYRGRIVFDNFDWENDSPLELNLEDLIIYEMHVRGFTQNPNSKVKNPGTFSGIQEKIPYLKNLGINCIELLPIFEFDEFENSKILDLTGERLMNYWGYSTVGFFAPKKGFAANKNDNGAINELKSLVKELHKNGIEVLLDVVFNHTAEGNEKGNYISFRGIDNKTYYMLTPEGFYYNFSGCGNTLNCNNPIVRNLILDCLRYWVAEYHIDGFRFDLASILGRDQDGIPMANPPLLESLAFDPILGKTKLIAEAWDAGGLYQVGSFPSWGRWVEWNGKYRDDMRKFLKGDGGLIWSIINKIQGSPDMYGFDDRGTTASINFITCHDGFTLTDLFSYNEKNNLANGEDNRDGTKDNFSWNCGFEGPTNLKDVNKLRKKQIKNAITLLMISHGIPMILSGDEMGNTQFGNNNAYCQDNEVSWLDWDRLKDNQDIFNYFKKIITLRKFHDILRVSDHIHSNLHENSGYPAISFHGLEAWNVNYDYETRVLGIMFTGLNKEMNKDEYIYVGINMHWETHNFEIPKLPQKKKWYQFANTALETGSDIYNIGSEIPIKNQNNIDIYDRSIVILLGK